MRFLPENAIRIQSCFPVKCVVGILSNFCLNISLMAYVCFRHVFRAYLFFPCLFAIPFAGSLRLGLRLVR